MVKSWSKSLIFPWIILFLFLNLFSRGDGATNERSRYATLQAMAEQQTFKINSYSHWTIDWAKTPAGDYYSNKAPGPMLLGYPLFSVLNFFSKFDRKLKRSDEGFRIDPVSSTPRVLMALFYQIIPFVILSLLLVTVFKSLDISHLGIHFSVLGILFGNTTSLFMNFFFGHAFAAMFILGMTLFILQRKYFLVGLFFGLSLLSDYGAGFVVPFLLMAIIYLEGLKFKWIKEFVFGGIIPGILWCWYHYTCFGGILTLPMKYQNPQFVDAATKSAPKLLGIFSFDLQWSVLFKLLFGGERGLLVTQPWILLIGLIAPFLAQTKLEKSIYLLSVGSLMGLLFMNMQFNGWHGGATSGPRYISLIFPSFAVLTGLLYGKMNKGQQILLWSGLSVALAFKGLSYGGRATAPEGHNLWPWLFNDMLSFPKNKGIMRGIVYVVTFSLTLFWVNQRSKGNKVETSF